jgi:hypothetical protein
VCNGDRTYPWDENAYCDICGRRGAYDLMGDTICLVCLDEMIDATEEFRDEEERGYDDY